MIRLKYINTDKEDKGHCGMKIGYVVSFFLLSDRIYNPVRLYVRILRIDMLVLQYLIIL